jgi:hypothetical protein
MSINPEPRYDAERARRYWRHAPSGEGKHDTGSLVASDAVHDVWDAAFRSRVLNYPEEEQFLRTFAERARGLRMVSIGSGLGFHELFYASAGARVTCCDIVATNLTAIREVAARKGLRVDTYHSDDVAAQPLPGGGSDVVFIYGCLMHMPAQAQRDLLRRAREALVPRGSVVLMVYAWEFARRACGWSDPSQFDPLLFARASDPAVGDEACPWSDWHDDAKLLDLAGDGARVIRRQSWNDGQFFWYELDWGIEPTMPRPFFNPAALEKGTPLLRLGPREFRPSEADVSRGWRRVTARLPPSRSDYALVSRTVESPTGANAVVIDLSVVDGAVSVGILDVEAQHFVSVAIRTAGGRQPMLLLADPLPARFQIVASNHQPVVPAPGEFLLGSACVLRRPLAAVPMAQARRP